jgi:hypothetical protein
MSISDGEHSKSAPTKSTGTSVEEIIGIKEKRPNGDTVYEERLVTTTRKGVNSDASESVTDSIVLNSRDGTYVLASKSSGMGGLMSGEWVNYSPPLVLYGSELSLGSKWKVGTARDGKLIMPLHAQVAGTETVTVPAGTFENCTKVHITCTKVTGTMGEGEDRAEVTGGKSITTIWIAPGVGVVKAASSP